MHEGILKVGTFARYPNPQVRIRSPRNYDSGRGIGSRQLPVGYFVASDTRSISGFVKWFGPETDFLSSLEHRSAAGLCRTVTAPSVESARCAREIPLIM